jgi:hypothetical protein
MSDSGRLADLLPSVLASMGVDPSTDTVAAGSRRLIELPRRRHVVVMLVDGLGESMLRRRGGHAPFLRSWHTDTARTRILHTGYPSTTVTSMATLGTGVLAGRHGLVGLEVRDPARDVLCSQLSWDPQVDPRVWQPVPTQFERAQEDGIDVIRIGPRMFDGSGLTDAVQRGGRFIAGHTLQDRVDATVRSLVEHDLRRQDDGALVYLYWGDLDKKGHLFGCDSWEWGDELAQIDAAIRQLVARLGPDTLILVTADHGMVDVPADQVTDLADEPVLADGIRMVGGEPRALHLYCEPRAAARVLGRWRDWFGDRIEVLDRDGAVEAGWFGPVDPHVLPRIGDVVTSARGSAAVVDSRTARPEALRLIGMHGARTEEEMLVPLLFTDGTR